MEPNQHYFFEVNNITKTFDNGSLNKKLIAVNNVSFKIKKCETIALVGASGSGKSTLGKILVRLLVPNSGNIIYNGVDIFKLKIDQFKPFRKDLQMVFQNPYSSLDKLCTVNEILAEGLLANKICSKKDKEDIINYLIDLVGLKQEDKHKFPYQLSGGQCQRVCIARSLSVEPKFIVFDEATSALDVIVQRQIIETIKNIQKKMNLTYLFISHNIALMSTIADKIAVMLNGEIVEIGPATDVYNNPSNIYTKQLIKASKNFSVFMDILK